MLLHELLERSAQTGPERVALIDAERGVQINYLALDTLSSKIRGALTDVGVCRGDRVGLYGSKSIATVAALFGALKAGGAYVPVDADAPPARNAFIFSDCAVRVIIVEKSRLDAFIGEGEDHGLQLDVAGPLEGLEPFGIELMLVKNAGSQQASVTRAVERLAYILYTSGSTGTPKGVVHTHDSALSFVDWCSETFDPVEEDCFSSHAPFHFDLSILDLYVSLKHGAPLVLIGESLGKQPKMLAAAIAEHEITMWYSTPSILRLLVEYGEMEQNDYSALRIVNFAGEVFPVKHLQALKKLWPHPRYFNLYGPTETNVCTFYQVPEMIPPERVEQLPIGRVCSNDRAKVVDAHEQIVEAGEEGELYVAGGSVMSGYWNMPDRTASVFVLDGDGVPWYRTGDVVKEDGEGNYQFLGRRDRMVKRRGYRVELGEIEAALYRHPEVREAAVVAVPDEESGVLITAYVCWAGDGRPSTIKMKQFSAGNLPLYMIPDRFTFMPHLPKTSTDKIDYQRLMKVE
jgi:amino acid adenylation domain-containing protein